MKRTWGAAFAAVVLMFSLNGCGGGPPNNVNPAPGDEQGGTSRNLLTFDAATFPDDNLRACLNQQAAKNNWQVVEDVESITCGDVEIRSIQGLQNFPNLHQLKIAAPRLPADEIPLLASLPLSDYQHKPYYDFGDESAPGNATPAMKQLLMDGRVNLSSDQVVTYVVLVAEDPAASDVPEWTQDRFDNNPIDASALPQGSVAVGPYVKLYWIQVGADSSEQFSARPYLNTVDGLSVRPEYFNNPSAMRSDRPIGAVDFQDDNLTACVNDAAAANGWTSTWQVTSLNCSGRGIGNIRNIDYLPQLQRVDLSDNDFYGVPLTKLPALQWIDLRGNTLDSDPQMILAKSNATVLYDQALIPPDAPDVEVRDCGLYIGNFDAGAQYRVFQANPSDFIFGVNYAYAYDRYPDQFAPWQAGAEPNCMPIAGRGTGIWIVDVIRNNVRVGAGKFPYTDADGNFKQYLFDDPNVNAWMTVPGDLDTDFYLLQATPDHYRVERHDLSSFQMNGVTETDDLLPYFSSRAGVYLFPARLPGSLDSQKAVLWDSQGQLGELPKRPLAGRPQNVLAFDGEIWLFGLHDEWGNTPDILVWNPDTQQWRQVQPSPSVRYSALIRDDRLCIHLLSQAAQDALCWNAQAQDWEPNQVADGYRSESVVVNGTRYSISRYDGLYQVIPLFGITKWPVSIADGTDPWGSVTNINPVASQSGLELQSLLDQQNPDTGDWSPFGPPLSGFPIRMNLAAKDGHLYALFNDSIVRYDLTPPPVSVISP